MRRKYKYVFNNFCKWCIFYCLNLFFLFLIDMMVFMYLVYICQVFCLLVKIEEVVSVILWVYNLVGYLNLCYFFLVIQVKEGVLRECRKLVIKKEFILFFYLFFFVEKYGNENSCFIDLRIIIICFLGYVGFFRFLEIVNIR